MQLSEEIEEMNFETNNNITQMMIEDNEEKKYS